MTIRPASSRQVVRALLDANDLPSADLDNSAIEFLALEENDAVTGIVGLEVYGPDALLRSLAVRADQRGAGHGHALVSAIESRALERGARAMYLLTTTAAPFFARLGYAPASRDGAPEAIRRTREFSQLCPSTAAFMAKTLSPAVTGSKH